MKNTYFTRRSFLKTSALSAAALSLPTPLLQAQGAGRDGELIQGFEDRGSGNIHEGWMSVSDRKIKVGIIGEGVCSFGSQFGFQDHPNVEVVAVSDLIPERCKRLAEATRCKKTYPSLEELVKDPEVEAVYIATDAPSHFKHAMCALEHGKHVACAVPAVFGSLEDAERLFEKVKSSGLTYMLFETSTYHEDLFAMRQLYQAGELGKIVYAEGEYFHYMPEPIDSFKGWRDGLPPQWYPTHSNAYYIAVTNGSFTEVSCMGIPSIVPYLMAKNNRYKNPFGTEIALFRTHEGGMARMAVSWDTPGAHGEMGRIRGQRGSFYGQYEGEPIEPIVAKRPPLPPTVDGGGHGGSHGFLTNDFILSIIENRKPIVDIAMALNLTVPGIVAHQSALQEGALLKIPQYKF